MTLPKLMPVIRMFANGKSIDWGVDVSHFPKIRYLCITALGLNGELPVCATPFWTPKNVRLRKKNTKKKGPLRRNDEWVPKQIHKYMCDFVHVMMIGEAWGK